MITICPKSDLVAHLIAALSRCPLNAKVGIEHATDVHYGPIKEILIDESGNAVTLVFEEPKHALDF